ncbi:MAG TPA: hypothetical protein VFJ52_01365, partial [Terriglobia bacterium]|nr:hypothetical protein [Terriglobia bacterium]
ARLTTSIARSTPAQNPLGFASITFRGKVRSFGMTYTSEKHLIVYAIKSQGKRQSGRQACSIVGLQRAQRID